MFSKFISLFVGFRKFSAFLLYFFITTILMVLHFIDGDVYMSQVTTGLAAYLGTNIGEHLLNLGKDWLNKKQNKEKVSE